MEGLRNAIGVVSNAQDVDTLRSLEEALHSFAGSAIVISHDRHVLV